MVADGDRLTIALISEVFFADTDGEQLQALLAEARRRGAVLAVLPELPLNPWSPATRIPVDADAEPPRGPRYHRLAAAARAAGIALLGGVIEREPGSGRRYNTSLLLSATGELLGSYRKLHLPQEEGFWETDHYRPGDDPPAVINGLPLVIGVQVCSDANRPEGSQLLAAQGAELVLHPRATPAETYPRWRLVLRANAVTSSTYLVSVNRPRPEQGAPIGGPSLVIAPDGGVLLESSEPVATATLERSVVRRSRRDYPGYLPIRARLFADAWARIAAQQR